MKVLIVEDETIAYEYLSKLIAKVAPDIRIMSATESIYQTVNWLKTNSAPDLIFMDIHLSDGSAFSIFELITVEIPIIFTTAFDEYAINAFKVNSIDYLLKPIEENDLKKLLINFGNSLYLKKITTYYNRLKQISQETILRNCLFPIKII